MNETADSRVMKIRELIARYKNFMLTPKGEEETYKWAAVYQFRKSFDLKAENFFEMLSGALSKTENLLSSDSYYAKKMILLFAEKNPEGVRKLFEQLYDAEKPLQQRFELFRDKTEEYADKLHLENPGGKALKPYQDLRAIMWYLTLFQPEKYFPYKWSVCNTAGKYIGLEETDVPEKTSVWRAEQNERLCKMVLEQVKQDDALLHMQQARLDQRMPGLGAADPEHHLLVFDILFFLENYMLKEPDGEYWPSPEEYDPEISSGQWKELLSDPEINYESSMKMLTMMLQEGGESTCAHLAEVYGETSDYYNLTGRMFAQRVKQKLECPDCIDGEVVRYFPVAFVGRHVIENERKRYSWKMREELKEALKSMQLKTYYPIGNCGADRSFSKNMILCGPPGTGKTYHTVIYAVAIIEGKPLEEVEKEPYCEVVQRYQKFKKDNRVAFTTFHQSYGYEDFIEGIRPEVDSAVKDGDISDGMRYRVEAGIFKNFCEQAQKPVNPDQTDWALNEAPIIWKVSLERTGPNDTRTECLKNGHIRIGWDDYGEDITEQDEYAQGGARILNTFYNRMRVGDLVFSCYSASQIDAIGVITGAPEWNEEYPSYRRVRNVKWLAKDFLEDIQEVNGGHAMVQGTVYQLSNVSLEDAYRLIEKYSKPQKKPERVPYVFIIDEINRGNISKIFGELITLMEENKRVGAEEEMRVRLPYSHQSFGVPDNVYIIGTMNTADRSVTALDTALRRRFRFVEMMPEPVKVLGELEILADGKKLSAAKILDTMNRRIEALYDREHTIGHAYFKPLEYEPVIEKLGEIFNDRIIPLLQEYFFDDYEKIRMVLGDNQKKGAGKVEFISVVEDDYLKLFGVTDPEQRVNQRYQINRQAAAQAEAYEYLC